SSLPNMRETTSTWGGSAASPSCARSLLPPGCRAQSARAAPDWRGAWGGSGGGQGGATRGTGLPAGGGTGGGGPGHRPPPPFRSDYTGQGKSAFSTRKDTERKQSGEEDY